jgi:L-amino acid N-acyltransferase YncA
LRAVRRHLVVIRLATTDDAAAVQAIYAPVVLTSAASFEVTPPTPDEMATRISDTMPDYPWLVAEQDARVLGYAYGHRFAARAAYAWSVETSIYVHADARGQRVGTRLYSALVRVLTMQGYRQAFAGIRLPNAPSVALHEALGFRPAGVYENVGWKFDEWHDVGWWQLGLTATGGEPDLPRTVAQLDRAVISAALS